MHGRVDLHIRAGRYSVVVTMAGTSNIGPAPRPGSHGTFAASSVLPGSRYAGTGRRFLALFLDVLTLFLTMPLWMALLAFGPLAGAVGGAYSGAVGVVAVWLVYFTATWGSGHSIGMFALGIRLERAEGGGPPGVVRGFVRAILGGTPVIALFLLLVAGFSDAPEEGYSAADRALLLGSGLVFAIGLLAHLWMIVDRHHQSLIDRVAGVVVLSNRPRG
jgi:uncharacterized RDD family membrane protein YckC